MNKLRVIDLLNKIANGEEVPKEIEIEGEDDIFYYQEDINSYKNYHNQYLMCDYLFNTARLNKEIYIVDKKIEKLKWNEKSSYNQEVDTKKIQKILLSRSEQLKSSINEIIDYLEEKE